VSQLEGRTAACPDRVGRSDINPPHPPRLTLNELASELCALRELCGEFRDFAFSPASADEMPLELSHTPLLGIED
jgi:hypothetical protein